MKHVFVYGTLRKGMYNYEKYLKNSKFLKKGYVKGELYTLRGLTYPALVPGECFILGELYEITDDVDKALDGLENYVPNDPQNEYNKITRTIYEEDKKTVLLQADVYMFNMDKEAHRTLLETPIRENDYVSFMRK